MKKLSLLFICILSCTISIAQNFADIYDCPYFPRNCKDSKRLSWSLTGYHGGWRLGILNDDDKSIPFNYQKMIFLK